MFDRSSSLVCPQAFFGGFDNQGFNHLPGMGPGMGIGFPGMGRFREQFRCYSMVFSTKESVEVKHGGKIIMPSSALEKLARLNITYPMLFKLNNEKSGLYSHCGVLEFIGGGGPHIHPTLGESFTRTS